jgi:hypothetical protein
MPEQLVLFDVNVVCGKCWYGVHSRLSVGIMTATICTKSISPFNSLGMEEKTFKDSRVPRQTITELQEIPAMR